MNIEYLHSDSDSDLEDCRRQLFFTGLNVNTWGQNLNYTYSSFVFYRKKKDYTPENSAQTPLNPYLNKETQTYKYFGFLLKKTELCL